MDNLERLIKIDKPLLILIHFPSSPHKFPIRDQQLLLPDRYHVRASPPAHHEGESLQDMEWNTAHKSQSTDMEMGYHPGKTQPPGAPPGVQGLGSGP